MGIIRDTAKKLKKNGRYISIDLYSTLSSEYQRGEKTDELYTRKNFKTGTFADTGNVHFFDKEHICELFNEFRILHLEHKIHKKEIPKDDYVFAAWNLVVEKK